jgi:isocitrate dehydrogenase
VIGADVFVETGDLPPVLGPTLETLAEGTALKLKMVSNRGTQVYPDKGTMIDCVDHYRCRFVLRDPQGELSDSQLLELLTRIGSKYRWMHIEKLQEFDGQPSYTKAQGED